MSHKIVTRNILTITGYINGFSKEKLSQMFLNIKANPLNALVVPNYEKELK